MKEYKVLSQKDKFFSGKFDPAVLEEVINSYASQDWVLKAAFTVSVPNGFGGKREECLIIMEHDA